MKSLGLRALVVALLLTAPACNNNDSSSTTTPAPPTTTETLSGVVAAAVNGVSQSSFVSFTVGQAGTTALTLTSAVETFPGGTLNPSVVVGLAVGTGNSTGTACTLGTTPVLVQAGPTTYSVSLAAGPACVQVSDQTVQTGPVAYTVIVVHT